MKKLILFILPVVLLVSCSPYSPKRYKEYSGIDYNVYETPRASDEVIPDAEEEIKQENIGSYEAEEITEEEIIESSNQAYGEAVVVMASKKIPLGGKATAEDLDTFQTALDNSYNNVLKSYRTEGFTYTLAPAGTVNPLSLINIQCLLSDNFANTAGKRVCDAFFAQIPVEYENAKLKKAQEQAD